MTGQNGIQDQDVGFALGVKKSLVSQTRQPVVDLGKSINRPSVARANLAVSKDTPSGTEGHAEKYKDYVSPGEVTNWNENHNLISCCELSCRCCNI